MLVSSYRVIQKYVETRNELGLKVDFFRKSINIFIKSKDNKYAVPLIIDSFKINQLVLQRY